MTSLTHQREEPGMPPAERARGGLRVLLLDNSVATTGAFLSAMAMVETLGDNINCEFVLPEDSGVHQIVDRSGLRSIGIPMVEIGRSFFRLIAYFPMLLLNGMRLRRILASRQVEVLVANDYFNLLPFVVRLTGWRGRIVTIVRLLPGSQLPFLNAVWLTAVSFAADAVVAVSRAVLAQLPARLDAKLVYFPVGRGIDSATYIAPVDNGGCQFLYLANYIRGKGQDEALDAFFRVVKNDPAATLRFVGGDMGLEKNRRYRAELEARSAKSGMAKSVSFAGAVGDVETEIRAADVILNFSKSESFSHTCMEAGLLGRPVVATRCGGPEEIIVDGETGYLVGIDDIEAMAKAMSRLAQDPVHRLDMGRAAFEYTKSAFSAKFFKEEMMAILRGASASGETS